MQKAARIATAVPMPAAIAEKSGSSAFVMVALFSGTGLLASLVAILMGVPAVWY
jgi:hypothetical protein